MTENKYKWPFTYNIEEHFDYCNPSKESKYRIRNKKEKWGGWLWIGFEGQNSTASHRASGDAKWLILD